MADMAPAAHASRRQVQGTSLLGMGSHAPAGSVRLCGQSGGNLPVGALLGLRARKAAVELQNSRPLLEDIAGVVTRQCATGSLFSGDCGHRGYIPVETLDFL